jgi:twitching motility two-component system response regulator PilH
MPRKILIVDDTDTDRQAVKNIVKQYNCDIIEAINGKQGFELAKAQKPDVIVMDIVMGEKSGFECLRDIRKDPDTAKIPVFLLSSKDLASDKFRGNQLGADAYLVKPVQARELMGAVGKYLA